MSGSAPYYMPKNIVTNDNIDTDETSIEKSEECETASTTRKDEARAILTAFPDILACDQGSRKEVKIGNSALNNLAVNLNLFIFTGFPRRRHCCNCWQRC